MVTPNSITFQQDNRHAQPLLVNVVVPRGTTPAQAVELRTALNGFWPERDVRVFEAPDLRQERLA